MFCLLIVLAIPGCSSKKDSPEYKEGYSVGYSTGKSEGYISGQQAGLSRSYLEVQKSAQDSGYNKGYETGFLDGKKAALPSGWSPSDGLAKIIFGASSIIGGIFLAGKILIFGYVLIENAKTASGSTLNFCTMIVLSLVTFFAIRIFGIEPSLVGLAVFPTPESASKIAFIVTLAAITTFLLILVVETLNRDVEGPTGLMLLSAAHGIFSTIVITIAVYTFKLNAPMGHVIVLIGMGVFLEPLSMV